MLCKYGGILCQSLLLLIGPPLLTSVFQLFSFYFVLTNSYSYRYPALSQPQPISLPSCKSHSHLPSLSCSSPDMTFSFAVITLPVSPHPVFLHTFSLFRTISYVYTPILFSLPPFYYQCFISHNHVSSVTSSLHAQPPLQCTIVPTDTHSIVAHSPIRMTYQ